MTRSESVVRARTGTTLGSLGESGVLARIVPLFSPGPGGPSDGGRVLLGPGDDAAVLRLDAPAVVTTDMLVEDHDFRREWGTGEDVGFKAAAQNLADVAAMGAEPVALVVSLGAPADTPVEWAEGLARGLARACRELTATGPQVVGGDLSGAERIVVSVTAIGRAPLAPVRRTCRAASGVLALAGTVGLAAAGLDLLLAGERDEVRWPPIAVQRRPRPPVDAGLLAAEHGALAMLDVSDGLLRDAGRLARAGGLGVDLDPQALATLLPGVAGAAERLGVDPWTWLLTGGEDHGLLAVFAGDVPEPFRAIGTVSRAEPAGVTVAGAPVERFRPGLGLGWDHFEAGPARDGVGS